MSRSTDEEKLLSFLPEDGSGILNRNLCEQLGWDEEKYLRVRDRLIEKGLVARGPGPGGSVKRLLDEENEGESEGSVDAENPRRGRRGEEDRLLALIPEDGSYISNRRLSEQLGWD